MDIRRVKVESVLNKHRKRDSWFLDDYSVNPYYGCSFSCVYCYTRGGKYGRLPHEIAAKANAPEVLDRQLRRRAQRGEYGFIALGTSTEPYMDVERELKLTRRILQVISHYRFPVHVLTKSPLVLRDTDLLDEISERAVVPEDLRGKVPGVIVTFSMSTVDDELAKIFEPGAPPPSERLQALKRLSDRGLRSGVAFIPVLPFISDDEEELRKGIIAAKESGASYVFVGALTLPRNVRDSYLKLLSRKFPEAVPLYAGIFRGDYPTRGYQDRLHRRASRICKEVGIRIGLVGS
ncbi:MAG TPA: radical SAM protein [Candidatus Korarchaeota archaeon]|nr:radical SAM protein [Candidatus Korarchaeota archaeon]